MMHTMSSNVSNVLFFFLQDALDEYILGAVQKKSDGEKTDPPDLDSKVKITKSDSTDSGSKTDSTDSSVKLKDKLRKKVIMKYIYRWELL